MDAGLIAMRMRLSGGSQVAAEAEIADTAIEKTAATTEAAGKRANRAAGGIRSSLTKQITAMRSIGRGLTKYVTAPILGVAAISGKFALDFDRNMRNVNSIAQLPQRQFERLKQSVLDLAGPTAQTPNTLAEGLYDLVSSGFNADEALFVLHKSALAASAGLTTTEVATKAVAASLNAYELPARRAGQVSDRLFETVNRGVLTFDQLATTIGDVLPFASQMGVGLEQVGAAISTMTKGGLSAAESTTRLKNTLTTMLKPGKELGKVLEGMGVSGEELVRKKGLQGALEAILAQTDGTKSAVAELFPNIRALGGVLALTGIHAKSAGEDLAAFKDTTGATAQVLHEQEKSFGFQMQRAWARLQAVLIEIGTQVLPIVVPPFIALLGAVSGAVNAFGDLPAPVKSTAGELAVLAALAGPMLLFASATLTAAKNLGILQATEAGTALNKGRLGRLGAGVAGIGAITAGQAIGGKPAEAVGNIAGGAALGFGVGGPWGAAIGAGAGAALTFGPELLGLVETEKKLTPLQARLKASSRAMGDAYMAASKQAENLRKNEGELTHAHRRHDKATYAVAQAQSHLNLTRQISGPNSRAVIRDEIRLARAKRQVTAATKAENQAQRKHGVELQVTKEMLRQAILQERRRIRVLDDSEKSLLAQRDRLKELAPNSDRLKSVNQQLTKVWEKQREVQAAKNKTEMQAAQTVGPKYARFLREGADKALKYGGAVKAAKREVAALSRTLKLLEIQIRSTDSAFEQGSLESRLSDPGGIRDQLEGAEGRQGRVEGHAHKHGGRGRPNTTSTEPTAGSSALEKLMSGGRGQRTVHHQPVIVALDARGRRVLAEGVVEVQDDEDARA